MMTNIKQVVLAFGAVALLMLGGEVVGENGVPQGNIHTIMETGGEQKNLPEESETPTRAPQATPTPTFAADAVTEMNCVMYAKNDVNIRKEPSTSGKLLGALKEGEGILVTGKCRDVSWYRVEYSGAVAYIHANYLTSVSPTATPLVQYANSFWAEEDGTVYVLDSYGRKLVRMEEDSVTEISLPGCLLPVDVLFHNQDIYIYDEILNEIRIYTLEGIFLEAIAVPIQKDYVRGFDAEDDVALLTFGGKRLVFHGNTATFSEEIYREKTVYSKGYDYTEYITTDASGIRYSVNTKILKDTSILAGELTVCASSADGEWIGEFVIPTLQCDWLPDHYVRVTKNGDVYVLMIQEEEFVVKKVELTRNPVSYMEEIRKETAKIEAAYEKESTRRIKNGATYRKAITLDRETVLERAVTMAEYEWTLTQKNTDMTIARRAQLPHYIAALTEEHAGQTGWEVAMKGIPYCWGGFVSPYAASYERFSKVIDKYLAGNIKSEGEYLAKTAGLDCSGYASALYGISWKLNTRQLSDVGTKKNSLSQLEKMDMLVAPGDHVVLFVEWMDERTILATESAIRDGRVTIHPRTLNSFLIENTFQMRSPW
ncbi:MAG: SH3 domain-containing protein [Lachnospiraceae bacterium]|nr:SH3 domain-containing protein [Lachnospiraceae bacterium]